PSRPVQPAPSRQPWRRRPSGLPAPSPRGRGKRRPRPGRWPWRGRWGTPSAAATGRSRRCSCRPWPRGAGAGARGPPRAGRGGVGVGVGLGPPRAGAQREAPAPAAQPAAGKPAPEPPDLRAFKASLLRRRGGDAASEAAVAEGLRWLGRQQAPDGHWALDGKGLIDDAAGTAFGLLPLLGAGHTHQGKGPYAGQVERGLRFLLARQNQEGHFGGSMYVQGLATLAFGHAYGLTADPWLREPAQRAVDYLVKAQHSAGGWRYTPRTPGDTSVTAWQVQALRVGRLA